MDLHNGRTKENATNHGQENPIGSAQRPPPEIEPIKKGQKEKYVQSEASKHSQLVQPPHTPRSAFLINASTEMSGSA